MTRKATLKIKAIDFKFKDADEVNSRDFAALAEMHLDQFLDASIEVDLNGIGLNWIYDFENIVIGYIQNNLGEPDLEERFKITFLIDFNLSVKHGA